MIFVFIAYICVIVVHFVLNVTFLQEQRRRGGKDARLSPHQVPADQKIESAHLQVDFKV